MAAPMNRKPKCARKLSLEETKALLNQDLDGDDVSDTDSVSEEEMDSEDSWRPDSKSDTDSNDSDTPSKTQAPAPPPHVKDNAAPPPHDNAAPPPHVNDNAAPPPHVKDNAAPPPHDNAAPPPHVNDNAAPPPHDNAAPPPHVNDNVAPPPHVNDNAAPPPHDNAAPPPHVNDNAAPPPHVNDNAAPPPHDNAAPPPHVNDNVAPPPHVNDNAAPPPHDNAAPPPHVNDNAAPPPQPENVHRGRRRKRDPSSWKRNIKASKRLRGEEYLGHRNKIHHAVIEGPACNCRKRCFMVVDPDCRAQIRDSFYQLPDTTSQRLYIKNFINITQPKRRYAGKDNTRRQVTFDYSVNINSTKIPICKQALVSILGIKTARINYVCDLMKTHNVPPEDKRGKHRNRPNRLPEQKKQEVLDFLDSIPKYRSHYTRRHNPNRHFLSPSLTQSKLHELYVEKCASQAVEPVTSRMFSEIFVTERNLHFGQPSLDTCKTCDRLEMEMKARPFDDELTREKELHLRKAEAGQAMLKKDLDTAKTNPNEWAIAFDFQQTLPTPHINTSVTFYSRQLWTYNLGIHDTINGTMNMWSEDVAGRGSSEVLSSLNKYVTNTPLAATDLIAWSDSCGGQNKNKNIISFWYDLVHIQKKFRTIVHKFPVPEHTFLPCDRDFGVIEKKKRKTPAVYNPEGWCRLVETARPSKPFKVVRMTRQDFYDIAPVKSQLLFRNTAIDGSKVQIQKATRMKICQDNPGRYFLAYSHNNDEEWQEVNIARAGPLKTVPLKPLYSGRREIAPAKLKDLKALSVYIPEEFRGFYTSLQVITPSPRKLRTGAVLQNTPALSSEDETDSNYEMPSSDSEFD